LFGRNNKTDIFAKEWILFRRNGRWKTLCWDENQIIPHLPLVLSNFACSLVHFLLIIKIVFTWLLEFFGQTSIWLHACLKRPSADSMNCIDSWSQFTVLVKTSVVPSLGLQSPFCGLMQNSPDASGVLVSCLPTKITHEMKSFIGKCNFRSYFDV
jgi:hypothetical protein